MHLASEQHNLFGQYLAAFQPHIRGQRTGHTFRGTVQGIVAAESLVCREDRGFPPLYLPLTHNAEQRIQRMANQETTKRSDLNATHIPLYHRLFSSCEKGLRSESKEVESALDCVGEAMGEHRDKVTYIVDSQFADAGVWGNLWEQGNHLVCRLKHRERLVQQKVGGRWKRVKVAEACLWAREVARVSNELVVRKRGRKPAKMQSVTAAVSTCSIKVRYVAERLRQIDEPAREKEVWPVEVRPEDVGGPWLQLADWPVDDEDAELWVFRMYRQRWAVEAGFKFTKEVRRRA
jgi:hypothetical protein